MPWQFVISLLADFTYLELSKQLDIANQLNEIKASVQVPGLFVGVLVSFGRVTSAEVNEVCRRRSSHR
jgi:hypothetical protein